MSLKKDLFGDKVKSWLGPTFDIFQQDKSIIPYLAYKPTPTSNR